MKTIESETEIMHEIFSRKNGKEAVEALEYMSTLSNYYHDNLDGNAELSSQGREIKVNWVYQKVLVFLDTGERMIK